MRSIFWCFRCFLRSSRIHSHCWCRREKVFPSENLWSVMRRSLWQSRAKFYEQKCFCQRQSEKLNFPPQRERRHNTTCNYQDDEKVLHKNLSCMWKIFHRTLHNFQVRDSRSKLIAESLHISEHNVALMHFSALHFILIISSSCELLTECRKEDDDDGGGAPMNVMHHISHSMT